LAVARHLLAQPRAEQLPDHASNSLFDPDGISAERAVNVPNRALADFAKSWSQMSQPVTCDIHFSLFSGIGTVLD
jgi:hypothetical protein